MIVMNIMRFRELKNINILKEHFHRFNFHLFTPRVNIESKILPRLI